MGTQLTSTKLLESKRCRVAAADILFLGLSPFSFFVSSFGCDSLDSGGDSLASFGESLDTAVPSVGHATASAKMPSSAYDMKFI
jgi:hypothetical protein